MKTAKEKRLRRIGLALVVLGLLIGAAAGLPWLVALPPGQRLLAAYANSVLAPGSVEFSAIEASWFRPSVVRGVTLRDAEGDALLTTPSLTFSWGLWKILVSRPKTAQLDLTGAKLDIERRGDGTIDLRETLRPVTPEHPRVQILVHVKSSRLRLRDPLLGEPLLARNLDVDLDMGRGYEPISWKISMAPERPRGESGRLQIEGSQSRARIDHFGRRDTQLGLEGSNWPFVVANADAGIECRGVFDGSVEANLQSGLWLAKGETKLRRFELSAPAFTKSIRLDTLSAGWNVRSTVSGWAVDRVSLQSSLLSLDGEGALPAASNGAARLEANIDLAVLAPYLPAVLRPRDDARAGHSHARFRAELKGGSDGIQTCDVRGTVSNLVTPPGAREALEAAAANEQAQGQPTDDLILSAHAQFDPHSNRLDLTAIGLELPFFHIQGAGAIRGLDGKSHVELSGTLDPDWRALTGLLADRVEPKAQIAGRPRPWRVSAELATLSWREVLENMTGELGIEIDELDVFGMRLGRSAIVARAEKGRLRVDPIDGTLNDGQLHLEPELARDEQGRMFLRLGKASHLEGAVINDEVSHRVLSYAAPILEGATRVKGRISARVDEAEFPIGARSLAEARVAGNLILDDVRFLPGRLADQLLVIFDRKDQPLLVLRDSIAVRIEDGKVRQKGLTIPVAGLASIALDGSVDFNKNLDLVATVAMSRGAPIAGVLPPVLQNARVDIPIRGTMQHPVIDATGFKDRLADIGMDIVGNSVEAGLDGLQRVIGGKSLKGLGDFFLPRLRPMSAPPGAETLDRDSKERQQPPTVPPDPEPPGSGAGSDQRTDGSDR